MPIGAEPVRRSTAQIVAFCRESGVSRLLSEDRDFDRFKGLEMERFGR